jgi:hypothetical protein
VQNPVLRRWRPGGALLIILASSALSTPARATPPPARAEVAEGLAAARLPAPFVLPELSHRRFDLGADWFVARLASNSPVRAGAMVGVFRPQIEASILAPRRIFIGATYPIAWALPPDGGLGPGEFGSPAGTKVLPGNIESHVRVVFPLPMALESGLMLAVTAPTSTVDRAVRANQSALVAASTVDPTNYVYFLPGRVALRPAADLRLLRGPFVFQARHGIDIVIDDAGFDSAKLAGRLLAHAGYLVRSNIEVSLEASQVYFFSSDEKVSGEVTTPAKAFGDRYRISDERRAAFALGPGFRFSSADADVGLSVVTSIGEPLSPAASSFVGVRLSVIGHVGRSP